MSVFKKISYKEAVDFLLPKHYSGRKPQVKYAFGEYINDELVAVVTYGIPASRSLCVGICGEEYSSKVIEMNRVCRIDNYSGILSKFIAFTLNYIKKHNLIVVSYADTGANHNGYIYQALNFIYTGKTKKRTDKYTEGNKHSRHYDKTVKEKYRKIRTPKHRYVYISGDKRFKNTVLKKMNYKQEPYPKEKNKEYNLGDFIQPEIIKISE